jgi:hypothetical protein
MTPVGGYHLFQEDTGLYGFDLDAGWYFLPEEKMEVYRARAEARRREAWDEFEVELAARGAASYSTALPGTEEDVAVARTGNGPSPPPEPVKRLFPDGPPPLVRLFFVSGFKLFRGELEAGLDYWEVLKIWECLIDEQRAPYDARARVKNRAAMRDAPRTGKGPRRYESLSQG